MSSWVAQLALMLGVLAAVTAIAELAGASNMGTALAFGTIAFSVTLVWILARD